MSAPLFLYALLTSRYCEWQCATASLVMTYQHARAHVQSPCHTSFKVGHGVASLTGVKYGQGLGPENR